MKAVQSIPGKIFNLDELKKQVTRWRLKNKKIVFTNGVFDILHEGHIASLSEAAAYGDILIVAVNADASVKRLKGPSRPVNPENARALLLASLSMTDAVIIFEDDTPLELVKALLPDIMVKGGDYTVEQIAGAKEIIANGGEVKLARIVEGISTTAIIAKMKAHA
ncbi:MAG: D-glycero-beta-D-manno-heptose 1-phosphate adenylyltransferase [Bacteroidetes bacterium]|nr:D-glycero-beta-D-manno-heptose 1-phosphate adenylyltransferase [Bacteroidota bacterium]